MWISVAKNIFGVSGLVVWLSALLAYNASFDFVDGAKAAAGTVVDLLEDRHGGSISYRPIVEFVTREGREVRFSEPTGSNPSIYTLGEAVTVLYAPDNPQEAKLNNFLSLWGFPVTLAALGGIFLLIYVLMILAIGRKNAAKRAA